jgi:hypothetical protein
MSAFVAAALLILSFSVSARAESPKLTVYAERPESLGSVSSQSLQQELLRLLDPQVEWIWKGSSVAAKEQTADWIAVGSFDGVCSTAEVPASARNHGMVLAHTAISNGRVLPFFRVDCGRILQILAPALRSLSTESREVVFGRALGRVIAHEIYHVLERTTEHQASGIAKPFLSVSDLTAEGVAFERRTVAAQVAPAMSRDSSDSR